MPMSYEPESTDEICRCGRLKKKIHCPSCGSYSILALGMNRTVKRNVPGFNEPKEFASFRCRRCASIFDDLEWRITCEAPHFETKSMKQRRIQQEGYTTWQKLIASKGGDRKEALKELFKNIKSPVTVPDTTEE